MVEVSFHTIGYRYPRVHVSDLMYIKYGEI
jgi:hypothetical protein